MQMKRLRQKVEWQSWVLSKAGWAFFLAISFCLSRAEVDPQRWVDPSEYSDTEIFYILQSTPVSTKGYHEVSAWGVYSKYNFPSLQFLKDDMLVLVAVVDF